LGATDGGDIFFCGRGALIGSPVFPFGCFVSFVVTLLHDSALFGAKLLKEADARRRLLAATGMVAGIIALALG